MHLSIVIVHVHLPKITFYLFSLLIFIFLYSWHPIFLCLLRHRTTCCISHICCVTPTHSSGVLLGLPTLLHFFLSLGMLHQVYSIQRFPITLHDTQTVHYAGTIGNLYKTYVKNASDYLLMFEVTVAVLQ